jgi:hypothetical protein
MANYLSCMVVVSSRSLIHVKTELLVLVLVLVLVPVEVGLVAGGQSVSTKWGRVGCRAARMSATSMRDASCTDSFWRNLMIGSANDMSTNERYKLVIFAALHWVHERLYDVHS